MQIPVLRYRFSSFDRSPINNRVTISSEHLFDTVNPSFLFEPVSRFGIGVERRNMGESNRVTKNGSLGLGQESPTVHSTLKELWYHSN